MANIKNENRLDSDIMDTEERNTPPSHPEGSFFEIHVKGHLDSQWSDWFDGLDAKLLDNGEMILSGTLIDQAALMGILNKLCRLNLTLLSVNELKRKDENRRQNE